MNFISLIRNKIKKAFDNIRNERVKQNLLQAVPFWIASIITGLIAVLYARLFAFAEQGTAYLYNQFSWIFFIVTPICFVIGYWLVTRFSPYARGSGIPQVMAAIELANPRHNDKVDYLLSIRIIFIKIISSLVVVFGAGIIGREGPTIQIAGSVFRKVNQLLPKWWPKISKRNMIMTGAAAGLAAAFNTPLGGIVFAVEELTKTHISYFKTALFSAVIIAGLTAQGLLGPYLYLGFPDISNLSGWIFFVVIFVAIIAGLAGSIMSKLILVLFKWRSTFKKKQQHLFYVIICAVAVAAFAFFFGLSAVGSGKELMATTLFTNDKYLPWYMPFLRTSGSLLTFTTGAAGGVFAPALSAGAAFGSVIANWFSLAPGDTNLVILCGMVAFLTGVTRTPFTSAILVLEMTDRNNVIFHLMLAGMVASLVAMIVDKRSFYDNLKHQYFHELINKQENISQNDEPVLNTN